MREWGAVVHMVGDQPDEAGQSASKFATTRGVVLVEDGRNPEIAEGAGTIGRELLGWPEDFDAVVVPLGDGALLNGIATWVKAFAPSTEVIGVVAHGAPAMQRSWTAREVVTASSDTIASGLAVQTPQPQAVSGLVRVVDDVVAVDDEALLGAMRLAAMHLGLVLEPSGAAGLAAVMTYPQRFRDRLVGTVLTGANIADGATSL